MINFLRQLPIQRKAMLVMLFAGMTTLLLAVGSMTVFQWIDARQTIMRDLQTQAEILAANSTAALSFTDSAAAGETLATVKVKPGILCAVLYQTDGQHFAHYGETEDFPAQLPPGLPDGFEPEGRHLSLLQPVMLNNRRIGTLYLHFDFTQLQWKMLTPFLGVLGGAVLVSLLLTLVLSMLLQQVITVPVLRLAKTVQMVEEQKDYSLRAEVRSGDEIGQLTAGFNQMLGRIQADDAALRQANEVLAHEVAERQKAQERLAQMQGLLIESSRQAGMAEIATGVLHNVGNVLNSVNVSATLISDRVASGAAGRLTQVTELLGKHAADLPAFFAGDPAGRQLLPFLEALSAVQKEERDQLLQETRLLRTNVDHIKEIVAMQQTYAGASGCLERLTPTDLLEDALKLHFASPARHGLRVERDYADTLSVLVDRHKLFQILLNLIGNAKLAIKDGQPADPRLLLRIRSLPEDRIRIEVIDNGVGIPAEKLTLIFAYGYTTRAKGHGFGLHTSALSAKEMGGSLTAHSEGAGRGATFTLELPCNTKQIQEVD